MERGHTTIGRLLLSSLLIAGLMGCGSNQHESDVQELALDASHGELEMSFTPGYADLATGDFARWQTDGEKRSNDNGQGLYPWPYSLLSIGHTNASYQNYGSEPYFHHGIDIRGDAGTTVVTPVGGQVVNIENYIRGNPAYWEVAIKDQDGFIWQFHHVEKTSIPDNVWSAYRNGQQEIPAGTKIGEIYAWSVDTFGERFHHVHLNILGRVGGQPGSYLNPMAFLQPLPDTQGPEFFDVRLLQNGQPTSGNTVRGDYSITADVRDLIMHRRFYVPPHEIQISVDGGPVHTVWRFDHLPGGPDREARVHDYFVQDLTCGNYSCRRLYADLGFGLEEQIKFPSAPGPHTINITAIDWAGNRAEKRFEWVVE